jgi:hypothetical protein
MTTRSVGARRGRTRAARMVSRTRLSRRNPCRPASSSSRRHVMSLIRLSQRVTCRGTPCRAEKAAVAWRASARATSSRAPSSTMWSSRRRFQRATVSGARPCHSVALKSRQHIREKPAVSSRVRHDSDLALDLADVLGWRWDCEESAQIWQNWCAMNPPLACPSPCKPLCTALHSLTQHFLGLQCRREDRIAADVRCEEKEQMKRPPVNLPTSTYLEVCIYIGIPYIRHLRGLTGH